jgi:hypothetical protein
MSSPFSLCDDNVVKHECFKEMDELTISFTLDLFRILFLHYQIPFDLVSAFNSSNQSTKQSGNMSLHILIHKLVCQLVKSCYRGVAIKSVAHNLLGSFGYWKLYQCRTTKSYGDYDKIQHIF